MRTLSSVPIHVQRYLLLCGVLMGLASLLSMLLTNAFVVSGEVLVSSDNRAQLQQAFEPRILFIMRVNDGKPVPYIMNADGSAKQPIAPDVFALEQWWAIGADLSPDGSTLAFASYDPATGMQTSGDEDVFLLDLESGDITQLSTQGYGNYDPVWSPDGTAIAYFAYAEDRFVEAIDVETQAVTLLLGGVVQVDSEEEAVYTTGFAWSPDGSRLAASEMILGLESHVTLFVLDSDGSNLHRVLPTGSEGAKPVWGSDNSLYYACWSSALEYELCQLDLDTSAVLQLTDFTDVFDDYFVRDLDVIADEVDDQIVLGMSIGADDDIYRYDVATGELINLTADVDDWVGSPRWVHWPVEIPSTPEPTPTP